MITLLENRIAIQPVFDSDRIGSIYIPDQAKSRCKQGLVKYVGPDVKDIKPLDYVFFPGYSGTVFSSRDNQEIPLTSVTVSGNELTATYTANFGGNEVPVTIKGPITGDDLDATMSLGTFRTMPLKAKRNK